MSAELSFEDQLKTLDPQQVEDNLQAHSDFVSENKSYVRSFTDQEIAEEDANLSSHTMDIFRLKAEIEEATRELRVKLKEATAEQNQTATTIRQGGYIAEGNIYGFFDQDSKMVKLYTNTGTLFETRPMTNSERKKSFNLFSV